MEQLILFLYFEKYRKTSWNGREKVLGFVDLGKAFDQVRREVLYWSLSKKGITEKHVRVIQSMCEGYKCCVEQRLQADFWWFLAREC